METIQQTIRRLVALSAVVLLCAAVPRYRFDRSAPTIQKPHAASGVSVSSLLPSSIGEFRVVRRWRTQMGNNVAENGGMYQNQEGNVVAQIALLTDFLGPHNGLKCYLARGLPLQRQSLERVAAADSASDFNIAFVSDESLTGAGEKYLLIATTECRAGGCTETPVERTNSLRVFWKWEDPDRPRRESHVVPLSVILQSTEGSSDRWSQEHALQQFRELMSNFKLLPLRNANLPN
jgi:hypothetical protein